MKVGFLSNQIDNRGTGNAMFEYAHYNEQLFDNQSRIYTFTSGQHNPIAVARFKERFGIISHINKASDVRNVDVLYHIKYGTDDGFRPSPNIRYAVHAVFEPSPHGDRFATVSRWLATHKREPLNFVPHIVSPVWTEQDFKKELGLNRNDVVIGRHGGFDTFDISWVWDEIQISLDKYSQLHYVFMNTKESLVHPRVHYLREGSPVEVRKFLNTCDVMLHARSRGETFGIAVGEFSVLGKPVMTYPDVAERAHIEELGINGFYYHSPSSLRYLIDQIVYKQYGPRYAYLEYTPHKVMLKFKEVFLD